LNKLPRDLSKLPDLSKAKPGNPKFNQFAKKKGAGEGKWDDWKKPGWHKDDWDDKHNHHHHHHHHGYWHHGIWIAPWAILYSQRWDYLEPVSTIVVGQKWLGVTYEPYEGGGAFVTGIYEGSPAQRVGLEVGDVIVAISGMDATNLSVAVRAAPEIALLEVLSGRTGELVRAEVNLIH
jgi:hypothetical protein